MAETKSEEKEYKNDTKMRNVCFTLNNYSDAEYTSILEWVKWQYVVIGKEVGDSGTPHLQGFGELNTQVRFSALKKLCPRARWTERYKTSTNAEAALYCKKDGAFEERGTPKQQGSRTDLKEIAKGLVEGKTSMDDLALDDPETFCRYYKAWERCEYIWLRKQHRKWMTQGLWFHGPTGTGKSHHAYANYNPQFCFVLCTKNGWWDGYKGQPIVIINDLKPREMECGVMLNIVDKWPYNVPIRGKEAVPFLARLVIVTSSMEPKELYNCNAEWNTDKDSGAQLERRFLSINLSQKYSGGNTKLQSLHRQVTEVYKKAFPENWENFVSEVEHK